MYLRPCNYDNNVIRELSANDAIWGSSQIGKKHGQAIQSEGWLCLGVSIIIALSASRQ
jgi:hypothetical protein